MRGAITRIEREWTESVESASKLEQKIERLKSVVLASKNKPTERTPVDDLLQVDMAVREDNLAKSRRYDVAGRTLRVWPVKGTSDKEVYEAGLDFIRRKLGVGPDEVEDSMIQKIRRTRPPEDRGSNGRQ